MFGADIFYPFPYPLLQFSGYRALSALWSIANPSPVFFSRKVRFSRIFFTTTTPTSRSIALVNRTPSYPFNPEESKQKVVVTLQILSSEGYEKKKKNQFWDGKISIQFRHSYFLVRQIPVPYHVSYPTPKKVPSLLPYFVRYELRQIFQVLLSSGNNNSRIEGSL